MPPFANTENVIVETLTADNVYLTFIVHEDVFIMVKNVGKENVTAVAS